MIKVFDVINLFGSGNTRGMAAGISEALVTTMAGLLTALSGVYFVSNLENRAETLAREFETELVEDK
jgi:biopolymer transport protein ExbB